MQIPDTIRLKLDAIRWFSRCGLPLPSLLPLECASVCTWDEATLLCGGEAWDLVTLEARNQLTRFLSRLHRAEDREWNGLVQDAKKLLNAGAWQSVDAYLQEHKLATIVSARVRWDTLNAVMEAAYQQLHPPMFFLKLLDVYEFGHFPCGWDGRFPDGRLLVL